MENVFCTNIFEPYLDSAENTSEFINYRSSDITYSDPEVGEDIDLVLCNWSGFLSISLKIRKEPYKDIFFETISNCTTGSIGWGYSSDADIFVYCTGFNTPKSTAYVFNIDTVRKLDINSYPKRYGITTTGLLSLYKTEGRIIPFRDFDHKVLFNFDTTGIIL
jgi:hypothetical protein